MKLYTFIKSNRDKENSPLNHNIKLELEKIIERDI